MKTAITIWIDESTDIQIDNKTYTLVGHLITNADTEEFSFLNQLKQARKENPMCWDTLHGTEIRETEDRKLNLIDRWLSIFYPRNKIKDGFPNTFFHAFLYKKNENFITQGQTYEHYFAKQTVFSLANKLKSEGTPLQTMFSNIGTIYVLLDRRRSHIAEIVKKSETKSEINRLNDLENLYKEEIKKQFETVSNRNTSNGDLIVRFSFVSADCFDGIQFTDAMLYLIRQKLELKKNKFTDLFDKHFLSFGDKHTIKLGFQKIYEYDKKFNFFRSSA